MLVQRPSVFVRPTTTAHLAQTMSLLELTSAELRQRVESELANNPALELVEENHCPTCNRKLRGMMVVMFRAASGSGQFGDLTVARDEPGDLPLRQCVLGEIGKLKLATPQRTSIDVSYPINFQPTK